MLRIINGEATLQLGDLLVAKKKEPNPLSRESFYKIDEEDVIQRADEFVAVEYEESISWLKTQTNWLLVEGSVPITPKQIAEDIEFFEKKLRNIYGDVPKNKLSDEDLADIFETSYKLLTLRKLLATRSPKKPNKKRLFKKES